MILSVFRVLIGFALACIAAAIVQLAFATPNDVLDGRCRPAVLERRAGAARGDPWRRFLAPFALVAAAIGEWQSIRSWVYYALAGSRSPLPASSRSTRARPPGPTPS